MRESGEALVERLEYKRAEVLDLGCGDGTTAIANGETRSGRVGRRYCNKRSLGWKQAAESMALPLASFRKGMHRICTTEGSYFLISF